MKKIRKNLDVMASRKDRQYVSNFFCSHSNDTSKKKRKWIRPSTPSFGPVRGRISVKETLAALGPPAILYGTL